MTIKFSRLVKKRWPIKIRYDNDIIFIEVASVDKHLVMKIVAQLFQDCPAAILSQYMDTRIWDIGEKSQFINNLREKYPIEIFLASDYTTATPPDSGSKIFALNIYGKMNPEILDCTTNFGTSNLPNILYGIMQQPDDWRGELSSWNSLILKWFNLELEKNDQIIGLIERMKYIAINIDGNLFFCFTKIAPLNKFLKIMSQILKQHGYYIDLKLTPMGRDN
jgi:hypothetical protein